MIVPQARLDLAVKLDELPVTSLCDDAEEVASDALDWCQRYERALSEIEAIVSPRQFTEARQILKIIRDLED